MIQLRLVSSNTASNGCDSCTHMHAPQRTVSAATGPMAQTQHNTTQHNTTQHNTTQHNTTHATYEFSEAVDALTDERRDTQREGELLLPQLGDRVERCVGEIQQAVLEVVGSGSVFLARAGSERVNAGARAIASAVTRVPQSRRSRRRSRQCRRRTRHLRCCRASRGPPRGSSCTRATSVGRAAAAAAAVLGRAVRLASGSSGSSRRLKRTSGPSPEKSLSLPSVQRATTRAVGLPDTRLTMSSRNVIAGGRSAHTRTQHRGERGRRRV